MRATDFINEYRAAGKVSVAGTIKLGNQFKDTYEVVNTPISHLYEVRIDDSPRESYPSYYFYNKDTGACVGSFSINAMPDAADDASPIVRPGVQIVQPHMTLAPEVQGKGLGSLIYDTFLAGGNWLFATFDHSSGAGALWDRMATKGSNISVLYNFNSDTVVEPGTKQAQTAVRILGPKERFKNKQGIAEGRARYKEIEFVCANPDMCDATDPVKQQQLYKALTKIPGVIALYQDQSEYSEGQMSLSAIFKDPQVKKQILQTAKQFGVAVDLEQPVDDNYVDRAIRGEHYGQMQDVAESAEQVAISVRKGRNKFATEMTVNGEPAGSYQYNANTGRSIAEVDPKYKGKGYGKILVLHAIYTAAMSGMDFVEDESRTAEYDNVLDSLDSNGYAINDDGYWYVTEEGEQFLKQALKQGVAEVAAPPGVSHFVTQRPTYRSPEKVSANHRVGITYTDGASPETLNKIVRVTANSPEEAIKKSTIYFKRLGWNVVDTAHLGTLDEAVAEELEEGWKDWVAGGAMALGALGAQASDIVSQVVNPGDTVYSIARQNNVSPAVLFKLNGFNNNTKLTPGQEVKVPDVYTKDAKPVSKSAIAKGIKGAAARGGNVAKPVVKAEPKAAPVVKQKGVIDVKPVTDNPLEKVVLATAIKNGITGTELAAFMSQVAHESDNFKSMKEYGGSLDFRKYDPKYAPRKAKTLGNTKVGDGNKFKGRGFIQITGRYNYRIAGKAIGIDLVKNPKLAEDPAIAAKIAVWYWKLRVQPNVDNWNNVTDVTRPINPGMRGLKDRKENFNDYMELAQADATADKKEV